MKNILNKWMALAACLMALVLTAGTLPVTAAQSDTPTGTQEGTTIAILGADLTQEQHDALLKEFGASAQTKILTVTNEEEHQALDGVIPDEQIGTDAISSVMITFKKKGSGLLKYTDELDAYLDGVFSGMEARPSDRPPVRISVKTRLGTDSTQEAEALIRIYNRYPINELIVHPRSQKDLYKGTPDRDAFLLVWQNSVNPIVYNGNINCAEDVSEIARVCAEASRADGGAGEKAGKQLECVMAGRGFLSDPSLVRQCQGGELISARELEAFHAELYEKLGETLPGTAVLLSHMKELWFYMGQLFPEGGKCLKEIRRANNRVQYEAAVRVLLSS